MRERPVITAELIVAVASRRCALITVAPANNAAMTQNISLSGIIITLTRDYWQEIRPHKAACVFEERRAVLLLAKGCHPVVGYINRGRAKLI